MRAIKYRVDTDTGCWLWLGCVDRDGYGLRTINGKTTKAHRYEYEQKYGKIPKGLVLDHFVCQTPKCINPDHVEPVTIRENTRRGLARRGVLKAPDFVRRERRSLIASKT